MTPRYAVIPTYNRPNVCRDAIDSIFPQVDAIFVIDNGDQEEMPEDLEHSAPHWYVTRYEEQPVNLSHAWNLGLKLAEHDARRMESLEWDVAVINDDAIVPEGWMNAVTNNVRGTGSAAGCSGPFDVVLNKPGPVSLFMRMQGWAFVVRGETGLRADEQFRWWFGDSDLDWQARDLGGMAMVGGYTVDNRFANQSTSGVRAVIAAEDAARFQEKWRMPAW